MKATYHGLPFDRVYPDARDDRCPLYRLDPFDLGDHDHHFAQVKNRVPALLFESS